MCFVISVVYKSFLQRGTLGIGNSQDSYTLGQESRFH
jgi:hypothetical protein